MPGAHHAGRRQLQQALKRELSFFHAGGYGRQFRSQWRPTLLLRDSPICINYSSTGRQHECSQCPLFCLVPPASRETLVPCHHISLDGSGATIARLYQKGTQATLDQRYQEWLENLIREFDRF
jgi:hypothetical protein